MATHYLITNRQVSTHKQPGFLPAGRNEFLRADGREEAQDNLRFGRLNFNPDRKNDFSIELFPDLSYEELREYNKHARVPAKKELSSFKMFRELYDQMKNAPPNTADVLVFVHGFKNDLNVAVETVRRLHNLYVVPQDSPVKHIVLFTWPARKNVLKYRDDAQDAQNSGRALARALLKLRDFFRKDFIRDRKLIKPFCNQRMHLLCHSMGNRVLESMMRHLITDFPETTALFNEIVLAGADIDYDCLDDPKPLYRLIDLTERIHIYYHGKDVALGISETTKNAFNRLGRWGVKNSMNLPDDVYQANVSDIGDEKGFMEEALHHWYYIDSPAVVKDITEVFSGRVSAFAGIY
jgi:esterase/lipase superfamily enzyme